MSDPLVIENITSGYGPVTVLRDVSVRVGQGEIVALLGSNGAGKSTLLKTVVGLLHPSNGQILVDGANVASTATERIAQKGVVLCPEGRQLFGALSVQDNLMLGAYGHRRDRRGTQETLERVFTLFPILRERAGQMAGSMSGGQQQMAAIGRALMARPRVLLLDEPSLGLAPLVLRQVFEALEQLRQFGMTILVVEQNAMLTLELADRGYVLERGRISVEGTYADLQQDERVRAAYLGLEVQAAP
jgi:branched-chain amino acid transport system ATP-binding protein